jgi:S-layer protein
MAGILDGLTSAQQIEAIYVAYFGRAADGGGYIYWENAAHTMSPIAIANSFAVQTESEANYGLLANPIPTHTLDPLNPVQIAAVDAFLNEVYQNLFNRAADSGGLSYWQGQILSGAVTIGAAVYAIANGALGPDATAVLDKIAAATSFTALTYAANQGTGSPLTGSFLNAAVAAVHSVVDATTEAASVAASTAYAHLPAFAITASAATIAEGQSETFTVATTGTAVGTQLAYTVTGTGDAASDTTSGIVTIDANGNATVTVAVPTNHVVGDSGTLVMALVNGTVSPTVAVTDSTPAVYGQTFALTPGQDSAGVGAFVTPITGNNNLVVGAANGTGATFTLGDQIIAPAGSTGNTLTLSDLAAGPGTWNPTSLVGVTVSNIQTVNLLSSEAVTANTSTSAQGYTGLTALNVTSSGNAGNVDTITAAATTAVTVTDTETAATSAVLTVNGGSTVTISEANAFAVGAGSGITVKGGTGTTSVSVTQTETAAMQDQGVTVTDTNEALGTKAGVITSVTLNGLDTQAAAINDSALANLSISNVATAGATVTITEGPWTSPATTLNLTLSADKALTVADAGHTYTTLAVTTGATASTLAALTGFTGVTSETIAGSSVLTQTAGAMTGLATITVSGAAGLTDSDLAGIGTLTSVTSTSSGVINVALNGTQTAFTGSTGQDIVTLTTGATKAITGGSATNNEIVLNEAAPAVLTNITNFHMLGTNVLSSGTFNLAQLTGITSIDVQSATGVTETFSQVTAGTPLAIDAGGGGGGITYKTSDTVGFSDTLGLTIGGTAANIAPVTVTALTTTDSTGIAGIGTLSFTSYEAGAGLGNTITTLTDANLSALNISGNGSLTIGTTLNDGAPTLTITNTSTSTAASVINNLTDNALSTLILAGSDKTTITTLVDSAGVVAITNSGTSTATIGTTWTTASLANLTLTNGVALTLSDSLATGIAIGGSTDNAVVNLSLLGAGNHVVALGNGNDIVVSGAGNDTITVGNGNNSITGGAGGDAITLGTGVNTLVYRVTTDSVANNTTQAGMDVVTNVNFSVDTITLPGGVTTVFAPLAIATADNLGLLATLSGTAGLAGGAGTAFATANTAVVVTISAGTAAGTYLVTDDASGAGVAFSGADTIIKLVSSSGTAAVGSFTTAAATTFTMPTGVTSSVLLNSGTVQSPNGTTITTTTALYAAGDLTVAKGTATSLTLDATGNTTAVQFNTTNGAVSGANAASANFLTYTGVTNFTGSGLGDTVTYSTAALGDIVSSNAGGLGNLVLTGAAAAIVTVDLTSGVDQFKEVGAAAGAGIELGFLNVDAGAVTANRVNITTAAGTTHVVAGGVALGTITTNNTAAMAIDASNLNVAGSLLTIAYGSGAGALNITGLHGALTLGATVTNATTIVLGAPIVGAHVIMLGNEATVGISGGVASDTWTINAGGFTTGGDALTVSGPDTFIIGTGGAADLNYGAAGNVLNFSGSAASTVNLDNTVAHAFASTINNTGAGALTISDSGLATAAVGMVTLLGTGTDNVTTFGDAAFGLDRATLGATFTGTVNLTLAATAVATFLATGANTTATVTETGTGYTGVETITGSNAVSITAATGTGVMFDDSAATGSLSVASSGAGAHDVYFGTGAVNIFTSTNTTGVLSVAGNSAYTFNSTGSGTDKVIISAAGGDTIDAGTGASVIQWGNDGAVIPIAGVSTTVNYTNVNIGAVAVSNVTLHAANVLTFDLSAFQGNQVIDVGTGIAAAGAQAGIVTVANGAGTTTLGATGNVVFDEYASYANAGALQTALGVVATSLTYSAATHAAVGSLIVSYLNSTDHNIHVDLVTVAAGATNTQGVAVTNVVELANLVGIADFAHVAAANFAFIA